MRLFSSPLSLILIPSLAFLVMSGFSGCGTPEGTPADGKRWYNMHNCSSCHGPHGNDGRAPDIAGINMMFGSFITRLRTRGDSIMPEYPEDIISKQDAADIYSYLKSIKK